MRGREKLSCNAPFPILEIFKQILSSSGFLSECPAWMKLFFEHIPAVIDKTASSPSPNASPISIPDPRTIPYPIPNPN